MVCVSTAGLRNLCKPFCEKQLIHDNQGLCGTFRILQSDLLWQFPKLFVNYCLWSLQCPCNPLQLPESSWRQDKVKNLLHSYLKNNKNKENKTWSVLSFTALCSPMVHIYGTQIFRHFSTLFTLYYNHKYMTLVGERLNVSYITFILVNRYNYN